MAIAFLEIPSLGQVTVTVSIWVRFLGQEVFRLELEHAAHIDLTHIYGADVKLGQILYLVIGSCDGQLIYREHQLTAEIVDIEILGSVDDIYVQRQYLADVNGYLNGK